MQILLTNDDGIYAPGLRALRTELQKLGEVTVVAPATEQSGVGHSITLLTPLLTFDFRGDVDRLDVLKALPLAPWRVALGQLLAPTLILSAVQGLVLVVATAIQGMRAACVHSSFERVKPAI